MTDDTTSASAVPAASLPSDPAPRREQGAAPGAGCARLEPLLGANLLWFGRVLNRRFDALLSRRGDGMTMAQARILFTLDGAGPMTQKELAARTEVEPPTLGRTITLMERDGLVRRRGNPVDRRQRVVDLAARGRARIEMLVELLEETEQWLTHDMPAGSVGLMVEGLSSLRERLAAELGEQTCAGESSQARRGREG